MIEVFFQGVHWLNGAEVFNGTYKNGHRSGLGLFKDIDGNTFSGTWRDDQLEGEVNITCADGHVHKMSYKRGYPVDGTAPCKTFQVG